MRAPRHDDADQLRICPSWCVIRHGVTEGEDDYLHLSSALLVRRTVLRLAATIDPETGAVDGPHVLAGCEEYTLHEADVLIDALTQLVDAGAGLTADAGTPATAT